jgi:predicted restriction endonuclease
VKKKRRFVNFVSRSIGPAESFRRSRLNGMAERLFQDTQERFSFGKLRVLLDQRESLVEAAHLIPFGESRNDQPTNGLALCPNHHWAMDRHLIAPCPHAKKRAGIWRVNDQRLDDRIEGQRDLVALGGKAVIPPSEEKFYPALESLRWREEHLVTTYV